MYECTSDPGENDTTCSNIVGAFECSCNAGYSVTGSNCADNNEGKLAGSGSERIAIQHCNKIGSFKYNCKMGYTKSGNGCRCRRVRCKTDTCLQMADFLIRYRYKYIDECIGGHNIDVNG